MKKILLVDDHPMIVEGYAMALYKYFNGPKLLSTEKATNFVEAKKLIDKELAHGDFYDYAMVDFSMPLQNGLDWKNGGDIVLYLKSVMPECKSIIITGHTEVVTIYDIVKNVRPNGMVNKHEITPESVGLILEEIDKNSKYHSGEIRKILLQMEKNDVMYDDYNRAILVLLSKGYKLIDLENHVPLSLPTIKKRVAKMKEVFSVTDTANLVQFAIEEGFV